MEECHFEGQTPAREYVDDVLGAAKAVLSRLVADADRTWHAHVAEASLSDFHARHIFGDLRIDEPLRVILKQDVVLEVNARMQLVLPDVIKVTFLGDCVTYVEDMDGASLRRYDEKFVVRGEYQCFEVRREHSPVANGNENELVDGGTLVVSDGFHHRYFLAVFRADGNVLAIWAEGKLLGMRQKVWTVDGDQFTIS